MITMAYSVTILDSVGSRIGAIQFRWHRYKRANTKCKTRNSAITDKPRYAFRGQSR